MKNVPDIITGLKVKPAYLLVFALGLIVVVPALARLDGPLLAFVVLGTVSLGVAVVWVDQRSVTVPDSNERTSLSKIRDDREALQAVFGGLLDETTDSYLVYPSHPVTELRDQEGQPIPYAFTEKEKQVTTIVGAHAVARVQALLQLGGKTQRLWPITSNEFKDDWWNCDLVLIGGPLSNGCTARALREFKSPFNFSDDLKSIVEGGSADGPWPLPEERDGVDYGIVANLKRKSFKETRTCLVIAGLGALSALGGAFYLEKELTTLYEKFRDRPFACLAAVKKDVGFTAARQVKCLRTELVGE